MFKKIKKWYKTDEAGASGVPSKDKSRHGRGHTGSHHHHHQEGQSADRTNAFVAGEAAYSHGVCADGTVDYTAFQLCAYDPVLRVAAFVGDNEDGVVVGCSNAQTRLPLRRGVHWIACEFVCGTTHVLVMSPETLFCFDYSSMGASGENPKGSSALFYSGAGTQFTSLHIMQGVLGGVIGRRDGVLSFFKLVSTASSGEQNPSFSLVWASYKVNITASLISLKSSAPSTSSFSSPPVSSPTGAASPSDDNTISWIDSIPSNPNAVLCVSKRWGGVCKWYVSEDRASRFYEATGKDGTQCAVKACTATANGQSIVAVSADLCTLFVWSSEKDQKPDRRVAPYWVIGLNRFCGGKMGDLSSLQTAREEYFSFWSARSTENARQTPSQSVIMAGGNVWLNIVLDMENRSIVRVDDVYSTYLDGKDPTPSEKKVSESEGGPSSASQSRIAVSSQPRDEEEEVGSPSDLEKQLHQYGGEARASDALASSSESDEDSLGYILAVVPCWKDYWKTQWQINGDCDPHVVVIVADCGPFLTSPWARRGADSTGSPFTPLPLSEITFYDNSVNRIRDTYSSLDERLPAPPHMSVIKFGAPESKMIRDPNAAARQQALDAGRVPVGGWDSVLRGGSAALDGDCEPSPFVQFGLLSVGQRTHLRVCFETGDASQAPQSTDRSTFSPASCGSNVFMVEWLKGGFVSNTLSDGAGGEKMDAYTLVWRQPLSFYSPSLGPLTEASSACGRTVAELYSSHTTLMLGIVDIVTRQVHRRVLVTRNDIFGSTVLSGTNTEAGAPDAVNAQDKSTSTALPLLARSACLVGVRSSHTEENQDDESGLNAQGRPQDTAAMLSRIGNNASQLSNTGNGLLVELDDSSVVLLSLTGAGTWSEDYCVGSGRPISTSPFVHIPRALFPSGSSVSSMAVAWSPLPIVMTVPRSVSDSKRVSSGTKSQKNAPAETGSEVVKVSMKTLLAVCGLKDNRGVVVFDLCRSQPVAYHRDVATPLYTFCVNGAQPPKPPAFLSQTGKVVIEVPTFVTPDVNAVGVITFRDVSGAILMNVSITRVPAGEESSSTGDAGTDPSAPAQWAWRVDTTAGRDGSQEGWVRIPDPVRSSPDDGTQPKPRLRFMFDQSSEELHVSWVYPDASQSTGGEVLNNGSVAGVADALPLYCMSLGNTWPLAEPFYYQPQLLGDQGSVQPKRYTIPTDSETALWRACQGGQPSPSATPASPAPAGVLFVQSTIVSFWPCSKLLVSTFTSQTGARETSAPASATNIQYPSCALPNGFTVEAAELLSPDVTKSNILTGGVLVILCKNINRWRRVYFLNPLTLTPVAKPFQTLRYTSVDAVSMTTAHVDSLTHVYLFGVVDRDRLSALPPFPLLSHIVLGPISAVTTEEGTALRSEDVLRWRSMPEGLRTRRPFEHCEGAIPSSITNSTTYCSMLPAMPTGKEEKGFFKRLVTISLDEAVKQVDGILTEERRESFDDFQKRVVDPYSARMATAAPTTTTVGASAPAQKSNTPAAMTDRERLLGNAGATSTAGSRYEAIKQKAALDGTSMNEARRAMNENLDKLQERGERLNKLQLRSQELADEANTFHDLARQLKEKQRNSWL